MLNILQKISLFTWIIWCVIGVMLAMIYYGEYENLIWSKNTDAIKQKYVSEWGPIQKNLLRGEITVSGEKVGFFLITQKEIDAIVPHYSSGFQVAVGEYFPSVVGGDTHKNSSGNDVIGIGSRVCHSLAYDTYSSRNYSTQINKYCADQGILESTQRVEVIRSLQKMRDIFERNGQEFENYLHSFPLWKKQLFTFLYDYFPQTSGVLLLITWGIVFTVVIESCAFGAYFLKRRKSQNK